MRFVRAALAAAGLVLLLGGIPLGLAVLVGDPRPGLADLLAGDVSDRAVLAVLAVAAWLAWARFAAMVVAEAADLLRVGPAAAGLSGGRGPDRALAQALLAAMFLAVPLTTSPAQAVPVPTAVVVASPAPDDSGAGAGAAGRPGDGLIYRVQEGDQLGAIARRYLGHFDQYPAIQAANTDLIPDVAGPRGPDHIRAGWELRLPATATDRGPSVHASGHAHPRTRIERTPHHLSPPGARPAPSPPARQSHPPTQTGPAPVSVSRAGDAHPGWSLPGVSVPGGWLDLPLAAALAGAASTVWLRRRMRYLYPSDDEDGPSWDDPFNPEDPDQDGDLRPLPAVVTRVRRAVRAHAQTLPQVGTDPADPLHGSALRHTINHPDGTTPTHPTTGTHPAAASTPGPAAPGGRGETNRPRHAATRHTQPAAEPTTKALSATAGTNTERGDAADKAEIDNAVVIGKAEPIPAGGLGLTGPGAKAAVRAALVGALSPTTSGAAASGGQVVITREVLGSLLPGGAGTSGWGETVVVATDLQQALAIVAERLGTHAGRLPAAGAAGEGADQQLDLSASPLLLIAIAPVQAARTRLIELLQPDAGHRPLGALLLGEWAPGQTLSVDPDGYTASPPPGPGGSPSERDGRARGRLPVLDAATTIDLLQVLRDARTVPKPPAEPGTAGPTGEPPHDGKLPAAVLPEDRPHLVDAANGPGDLEPTPDNMTPRLADGNGTAGTAGKVKVTVLGRPTIFGRDGTAVKGLRKHATEILVYLAIHPSGASVAEIMEATWPDATVHRAEQRLSTEIANLRRSIRIAAADTGLQPVVNTGGHYHLEPTILDIDVWQLQQHLREVSTAQNPRERTAALRAALDLSGGILAERHEYDWIDADRERLRRQSIRVRLALADDPDTHTREAADLNTQAADLDPANEELARRAMRALAAIGDTAGVQERLHRLRTELKNIGEEPSPETLAVAETLALTTAQTPA